MSAKMNYKNIIEIYHKNITVTLCNISVIYIYVQCLYLCNTYWEKLKHFKDFLKEFIELIFLILV